MSTTAKQLHANRANARKSTGPTTVQGKLAAGRNATQHGILSTRLVLEGEDPEDFQALLGGLAAALQPVGTLEVALVEKVAVALWKQRRLTQAESARIELNRLPGRIADSVALELNLNSVFQEADLQPPDRDQLAWCQQVLAEYDALATLDRLPSADQAPLIHEQLSQEADSEEESIDAYLSQVGGLRAYLIDLASYCRDHLNKADRFPLLEKTATRVKAKTLLTADDQDTLNRYFTTLDNQLYKALRALKEAQAWRLNSLEGAPSGSTRNEPATVAALA